LYRLTDKGTKAALMFVLFHQRVCGPLANSLFHYRPDGIFKPTSKIEAAYHKANHAIQQVLDQLAACTLTENSERRFLRFGHARN